MILQYVLWVFLVLLGILAATLVLLAAGYYADRFPRKRVASRSAASQGNPHGEAMRAIVLCNTVYPSIPRRFETQGYVDCAHAASAFGGTPACPSACLGLGSCTVTCPSGAISIGQGRIFVTDACVGCGACVDSCPRGLFSLIPLSERRSFRCAGQKHSSTADFCETAKNGHLLDFHEFPDSFFKTLDTWGIIRKKSRFE